MHVHRFAIAAFALAVTGAMAAVAVLGFRGGSPSGTLGAPARDPARSGRGAWLLNPYCRNVPAPGFDRPPNAPRTGQFDDAAYGYAVTIPAGLTAYVSAHQPAPGFGIVLSWEPRAYLRVDASYDVYFDISAAGVHRRDVQGLRLHDQLQSDSSVPAALGGEGADRYRMQFQCPGDAQIYLHDDFIVMRNREIYRLELQTVPARYERDAQLLTAMQRSWRWIPVPGSHATPAACSTRNCTSMEQAAR